MKILLVDDDTILSAALAEVLANNFYTIEVANDGETGLQLATAVEYDLILLDLQIPKLDGISLCRKMRAQGYHKPILLLTAKNSNADVVAGLDAGADDYVIKPYNSEALLARIRALLRRPQILDSSIITWGNLCLNLTAGKVILKNQEISLTATEYKLLQLFLQNPERIFSRSVILDRLWGLEEAPAENAITVHIKDLRKRLKNAGLAEEIIQTIYGMGYRLKPNPNPSDAANSATPPANDDQKKPDKNMASVNQVLEKFRDSFAEQVTVLQQAKNAFLAGNCQQQLQQAAKHEAHKLAGSMGTFGYPEGSILARKAEHLLGVDHPLSLEQISQFSQLVDELQQQLTKPPIAYSTQPAVPSRQTHRLLVIDDDVMLTQQLQTEGNAWGFRIKIAHDLTTARSRLAVATPDVILLDLSFPETEEDGLNLLRELTQQYPDLPVVVFTAKDSLANRLAVSRLGAKQFLHKPAPIEQIFQTINRVLPQAKTSEAKVLIVDDDPISLEVLSLLLTAWGVEVITLAKPQHFWQVLTATEPHLLVLDLDMPVVSGLELCQVVRQDAHWGNLPILVVTAHTDAQSLQQAFAAGADDFISKPILGPELVTRVLSRLDRIKNEAIGHTDNKARERKQL